MAKPQHRTPEYRAAVKHWASVIATTGTTCVEVICRLPSRDIPRGAPRSTWHTAHDPSGTFVIGASHVRCNEYEAAQRRGGKNRWVI